MNNHGRSREEGNPLMQSSTAAGTAVPAATPVEIAERVEEDMDDSKSERSMSPKSFNSDEIFDDVDMECGEEERISDHDLDRLLGPVPLRRASGAIDNNMHSLETESASSDRRRKKRSKGLCPCCPQVVQRGPWQCIAAVTGRDGSVPNTRVGNMIVILPKCFNVYGFGIMGPHWFGPLCCVGLLTGATFYFGRKAYHTIGVGSAAICLLFYITALVSLFIVSCSDPGVVKADSRYEGVPTDVSAGRGWRYCDLCSCHQPPGAVHCPDCNVCIEGYDHHCPWMGTCIGKKNFTSFMTFNLTWLFYFLYAIIWVSFVGAAFYDPYTRIDSSSDD